MRNRRPLLIALIVAIPLLIGAAAAIGLYINQRALTRMALQSVNEQFGGQLVIEDSYLALFAQFPYISIDLEGVRFFETKAMDTTPIYQAKDIYLGFNIFEVISGNYRVHSVKVSQGALNLIKYADGSINLLKAKNMEEPQGSSDEALSLELKELRLDGFSFTYRDETMGQELVSQIGKFRSLIRLGEDGILIDLMSDMVLNVLKDGEPTFFTNKLITLDWEVGYMSEQNLVQISPSSLGIQEALFTIEGTINLNEGIDTDVKIYGEKPDFSIFAALAPEEVAEVLKRYQNQGEIYFLGTILGKAGNGSMPAIAVEFGCENAYFENTAMEKRIDQLRFSGFFTNGKERNLKTSEFRLQQFSAKPDEGEFEGQLVIRDFEDPFIKVNLHADLDLEFLGQFFEIEGLRRIRGNVLLDMDFDELIDLDMPSDQIARIKEGLDSELTIRNLSFEVPGFPHPITDANGYAVMENGQIKLDFLKFNVGASDFEFSGSLSDFPAVFHGRDMPVTASLKARSDKVIFSELLAFDPSLSDSTDEELSGFSVSLSLDTQGSELVNFEYLPKGKFKLQDLYGKLKDYPHAFHDFDVLIAIDSEQLEVEEFKGYIDTSDFRFSGILTHYDKWFKDVNTGISRFEFDLRSQSLVVRDLLSYNGENYLPDDYRDEVLREFSLIGSLDLNYDTTFQSADLVIDQLGGKLNIHPLKLEGFSGRLHFEKGNVLVEKFGGIMGQSDFEMDLAYFMGKDTTAKVRENQLAFRAKALDLDALLNYDPNATEPVSHADTFNIFELPFSDMNFVADIDRVNYHTYWFEDLRARLRTTPDHYLYVDTLSVRLADGGLSMNGYFNGSDSSHIYFHSTMVADKLDLDKMMVKFDNFGQDVMINENLHGKVSGTIVSKFLVHPDLTPIVDKSEAKMDLVVYDGSLVNFTPLQAMGAYFRDRNLNLVRFDTLQNTFDLRNGVLNIPRMNINSSLGFIEMSGRQGLDLNMDYFIRIPLGLVTQVGFRSLFGGKSRDEVDPDQEDAIVFRDENKKVRFVNLNISGDPDNFKVSLGRDRGQ
ncbi:AsmA-like C-terminal region-containing protein [Lunatimonas salinarum]|uniref:AsmA-like C-terminal region-containing protein n=1 Tax=Lunatimonas salinarum TaxID=1774590 RepID=UPI001AE01F72|nr:AsmA-like C-terminal region-containing protein [Lunatimonas salinarum]